MKSILPVFLLFVYVPLIGMAGFAAENQELKPFSGYADTITIASEPDYPPFCIVNEDGDADGFSVELFIAAARAVGMNVDVRIGVWNQIKKDLANGKIDALPLVGRTPEREEMFDFTMPYLSLHGAVFVSKGTTGIDGLADLKGKEIVVMKGDNAEEFVRREKISEKIFTTPTFEDAFRKLASGQYDALITQRVLGLHLLEELDLKNIKVLDFQVENFRQDFCFAVQQGDSLLLERLNEGLSIVIANDTYGEIRSIWFGPEGSDRITVRDVLRIALIVFLPLALLWVLLYIFVLRREVKRRTQGLNHEIAERKQVESELIQLKNQLEAKVAQRTSELEEKVKKLDKSQKAMLFMVEDLNCITRELKNERRKLEFANQELEAFTYSVSHDLRAPLRAINGFSGFLMEDYSDKLGDEGGRFIQTIQENATKMDGLITDLLNLSRVSRTSLNWSTVDMTQLARAVFQETATGQEKKLFHVSFDEMPVIKCDSGLIKQVWQNLIENALKYSSRSDTKKIRIGSYRNGKTFIFFVNDHGAGFNPRYKDRLFGVFQRLHKENEFEGTGVGLALVQRIIHRHGGEVWAEGEQHKGAVFNFSLPG